MERILLRSLQTIFPLFFLCLFSSAQDLTGIWKGYFTTDGGDQYKLEFQVRQKNPSSVTGVSYSYLDVRFYGKATMTGSLSKMDQRFQIQEIRTVEVKNMGAGGTCLMKYIFNYEKSGKEEFLEGTFIGKSEDRKNPKNNGQWGDCGGGKVYLRKVQSSDFYVEPFLRDNPIVKKDTSTKSRTAPPVVKNTNPKSTAPVKKPVVKKPVVVAKKKPSIIKPGTKNDTVKTILPTIKSPVVEKKIITPEILRTRQNALAQTLTVNTQEVTIKLYDNGEIDDDTISVFVDKQLKLSHRRLSTAPIVLTLKFDENDNDHEVVMVAENLGRIPPNTSLMVITSGDKRYQVQITSTEQKNAMVRFKYEKPQP